MKIASTILVLMLFGSTLATRAASPSESIFGLSDNSCGMWVSPDPSTPSTKIELRDWMLGYLSGAYIAASQAGTVPKGILSRTTITGALAWIDKYCADHPLVNLDVAGTMLINTLSEMPTKKSN